MSVLIIVDYKRKVLFVFYLSKLYFLTTLVHEGEFMYWSWDANHFFSFEATRDSWQI